MQGRLVPRLVVGATSRASARGRVDRPVLAESSVEDLNPPDSELRESPDVSRQFDILVTSSADPVCYRGEAGGRIAEGVFRRNRTHQRMQSTLSALLPIGHGRGTARALR